MGLPWWMMFTGVSYVTPTTIPVIIERMKLGFVESYTPFAEDLKDEGGVSAVLTSLVGFEANVSWETNAEFLKKLGRKLTKLPAQYDPWKELRDLQKTV